MKSVRLITFSALCLFLTGCNILGPQDQSSQVTQETPVPAPTPSLDPQLEADARAIAGLLANEPSLPAGEITVIPAYNDGSFATGTLSHTYPDAVKNKIWIAAKENGNWVLVHYGSPGVDCEAVDHYSVPSQIVQVCIDTNGDLVTRQDK